MKATLNFDDPRWDVAETERKLSAAVVVSRKELKEAIREKHREGGSKASGAIVSNGSGDGFRRRHRRSSRGNPPAPETLTLLNAVDDRELGPLEGEVFIKPNKNPRGGVADEYGAVLDNPAQLNRPFFQSTADAYQETFDRRISEVLG